MDENKLFLVINNLFEKTKDGLIDWHVGGTNDDSWDTPIGKAWISIRSNANGGYTFQVINDKALLINVCTTAPCMGALYKLVTEKMSTENKILDQVLAELQKVTRKYDDSYYKD